VDVLDTLGDRVDDQEIKLDLLRGIVALGVIVTIDVCDSSCVALIVMVPRGVLLPNDDLE